ncbi:hypothetical protein FHS13_003815 [Nocardiopsis algeriensis]|uniref:Uncharacterized protein n=1 Tax=Nocardiopsis algeriensis TaxID=1478215 RepID=A0A841IX30_9ACTN|nr:hypothetical protein [Nocardiopsis algeriensis]
MNWPGSPACGTSSGRTSGWGCPHERAPCLLGTPHLPG